MYLHFRSVRCTCASFLEFHPAATFFFFEFSVGLPATTNVRIKSLAQMWREDNAAVSQIVVSPAQITYSRFFNVVPSCPMYAKLCSDTLSTEIICERIGYVFHAPCVRFSVFILEKLSFDVHGRYNVIFFLFFFVFRNGFGIAMANPFASTHASPTRDAHGMA